MPKDKNAANAKPKDAAEIPVEELAAKLERHKRDLARITAEMADLVQRIRDKDKPRIKAKAK